MTKFPAPSDALPLPLKPEEITARWLTAALCQRRPEITVTHAETVDVIWGTSTKIRVRARYEGPGSEELPPTVIVKGGFEEHSPAMAAMYANEIRFYADIQPFITIPSPQCYFAGTDPGSHQSIVIMEDLRREGVIFCDPLRPQSFEQVAARIDAMARYHAETWDSPEFEPGGRWADIGSRFDTWGLEYMRRYLVPDVWAHYMASPRGAACSVTLQDREWMEQALQTIGDIQFRQPRCMVHGDTHLGNLYIDEQGRPGFFDAQVARTAWHHEVSYHIVCALDLADRARWEGALLERYLRELRRNGVHAPSFDEAWLDYRRSLAWGLFIFLTNEIRFQTESVNTAYAARFSAAALDHDLKRLLS
jgi:aminoglycoside/choline kinase family phosphotransferase